MANLIYLKIKGTSQGSISKGCSTYDPIGNKYQHGHEDQVYVYSFDYDINREQNISHSPVIISKPIDKSSPLLGVAITNNEILECELAFYRTSAHGNQEKHYSVKLTKASITNISAHYPNSLTHADAQAYEDITMKYESISWNHICAGTSGYSIRQNL